MELAEVPGKGRTALCICGGGITGAMYEVGALVALEEFFGDRFDISRFDIYVGTSAGSVVAACAAGGIPARRLFRALLDPDDDFVGAGRHHVYQLDVREILEIARKLAGIALRHAGRAMRGKPIPLREVMPDLEDALPSGLFSIQHYERFLWKFFARHGIPTRFSDFRRELYITANDLDSGHREVFGEPDAPDIPVPTAIGASSAIPVFFEPVRFAGRDFIDGGAGKVAHTDVAIHHGASLIVIINPMVPAAHGQEDVQTAMGPRPRLRDKGMIAIWEQAARINTKTKLHQGLRRWAAERPDVTLFLIEPEEESAHQFLNNPMNFSLRRDMLRAGYDSAFKQIRARAHLLTRAFARAGVDLGDSRVRSGAWGKLEVG